MDQSSKDVTPSAFRPVPAPAGLPRRWSRFDRSVAIILALFLSAIGLTIASGDRVGVTLERVGPLGTARSTSPVVLQFSESMNRDTVPSRVRLIQIRSEDAGQDPIEALAEISGSGTWNGSTYTFRPDAALQPGATYQVMLAQGATSESGREVLSEYRYSFTVRRPYVAYLAPSTNVPRNIWIANPDDLATARQLTFTPGEIYDFSISPDGERIAFSEANSSTGTMDIKLVTVETGAIEQVTNCVDSVCRTPSWRPDGQVIAYERIDLNSNLSQSLGASPSRIWLIDLSTRPATTRPLFDDSQILGYGLRWSKDGQIVSLFDYASQGILVYNFGTQQSIIIPSLYGNPGELSPDGNRVIFPEILLNESQATAYLNLVDIAGRETRPLAEPGTVDDDIGIWSPDGSFLVIGRKLDGGRSRSLFRMNPDDGSVVELLQDPRYQNGFFSMDPTGTQLVIQRFPDPVAMNDPTNLGIPEVWTLDMTTGQLTQVALDAMLPRWVP